jgi:RNA polymerase sigma-70 factor (ECF subfamily)
MSMARLTDIHLTPEVLARARAGDERAQAEIYTAVAPATFTLIRRLVPQRAVAEDLFQDTLMAMLQHLESFRGDAPFGAWLRKIAIRKCLMFLRSPWNRVRLSLELSEDGRGSPTASWLEAHLSRPALREESLDVERAMASLSPTARAVIWLFEVEGYSHEEIAHEFGRTVSFSKSQVARAHRKLRAWFEPDGGQGGKESCSTIV